MHKINQLKKLRYHHLAVLLLVSVYALITVGCGPTQLVSKASSGAPGNGSSYTPSISADGRFVAFTSAADNFDQNDINSRRDVYVHDRENLTTERIFPTSHGTVQPSISGSGAYIALEVTVLQGNNLIYVINRLSHNSWLASISNDGITPANDGSFKPSISGDGRFVAFYSRATNLVDDDNNEVLDVFVRDRINQTNELISVDNSGNQGNYSSFSPSISADGRFVAFASDASNLVDDDTNEHIDVFVHDRANHTTEIISVRSNGNQGDADSQNPSISRDGRFVAFTSQADNLDPNDANALRDIFVHDRTNHTTELISVASNGNQGNRHSLLSFISADGRFVAFSSDATNLVRNDMNNATDIFVHVRANHTTERVSVDRYGFEGDHDSDFPVISADGRIVAFDSRASNLTVNRIEVRDVFVRDRDYNP